MRKNVNYAKSTLFDSSAAKFKLTVESKLTRVRPTDQTLESLCYVDMKGNMNLNPNIYLVFTYRGDTYEETKSLYTSYPQLFKIREALEYVKDVILSEASYVDIEGSLQIKPEYKDPIVIGDIGKDKKWISFGAAIMNDGENISKGVAIEISGQNQLASVLSVDEFLTIYSIVKNIDLVSLQLQFGLFSILNDDGQQYVPQANYNNQAPAYAPQPVYQNNGGYYQQQRNQNNYQGAPTNRPVAPRYNSQGRTVSNQRTVANDSVPSQPIIQPQYSTPQAQYMAPRQSNTPIVNMQAIDETPVDKTDWNDDAALNDFLNN